MIASTAPLENRATARGRRRLAFRLMRLTGVPFLVRELLQRRRVTLILYHDISPELAERHFARLRRHYNVIPLRRYVEARMRGRLEDLPRKPLVITFDDGHRGNAALKPVLERQEVPVTIFLCSGIIGTNRRFWFAAGLPRPEIERLKTIPDSERRLDLLEQGFDQAADHPDRLALSVEEIQELRPLVDFQSHTVSHPILPRCSQAEAREEIARSKRELEERLGLDIYAISYPNGDFHEREMALAQDAGYRCGVTVDVGYNGRATDLFRLKRICIADDDGIDELLVKVTGIWALLRRLGLGPRRSGDDPS